MATKYDRLCCQIQQRKKKRWNRSQCLILFHLIFVSFTAFFAEYGGSVTSQKIELKVPFGSLCPDGSCPFLSLDLWEILRPALREWVVFSFILRVVFHGRWKIYRWNIVNDTPILPPWNGSQLMLMVMALTSWSLACIVWFMMPSFYSDVMQVLHRLHWNQNY